MGLVRWADWWGWPSGADVMELVQWADPMGLARWGWLAGASWMGLTQWGWLDGADPMGWAHRLVQLPLLAPSEGMGSLLRLRWGGGGKGLGGSLGGGELLWAPCLVEVGRASSQGSPEGLFFLVSSFQFFFRGRYLFM